MSLSPDELAIICERMELMDRLPAAARKIIHDGYPVDISQLRTLVTWDDGRILEWLTGYQLHVREAMVGEFKRLERNSILEDSNRSPKADMYRALPGSKSTGSTLTRGTSTRRKG